MKKINKISLAFAISAATVLMGCGGGSDNNNTPPATNNDTDNGTVSGAVSAPGGAVALFEEKNAFQIALEFFITPVAAAITGLEPVAGATVELVRIDNDGQQTGEVLATTTTSTTGDYTLTLPAGVDLAGNLVVRITGMGGTEMRAQVVERELDITPVSEFVLRSFLDKGADLENLSTASVIKLSGQVEEFDLTAGSDLSEMLDRLEEETGAFVDDQIDVITTTPGDVTTVAGSYRNSSFQIGLHDDDGQYGVGSFSLNLWSVEDISLTDGGSGTVNISAGGEESAWSNLIHINSNYQLNYITEVDSESETFSALLGDNGVINIESPFEENIDGEFAWRSPPHIFRFQKAKNSNIFIALSEEVEVRYRTVDTNDDGQKDALDPTQREGDEVFRGMEFVVKKPTDATLADVNGNFGRVYLGVMQHNSGQIEVETERNTLAFDGTGTVTGLSTINYRSLQSSPLGISAYSTETLAAESGIAFTLSPDGDIPTIDDENTDGFMNEDFDFFMFNEPRATDDANPDDDLYEEILFGTTLGVKLPSQMLDITGRTYRVLFLSAEFDGSTIALYNTRFDTRLNITDATSGVLNGNLSSVSKAGRAAEVEASTETLTDRPIAISLNANGEMTLTISDEGGDTTQMEGYLNHDGSLGVFNTIYTPSEGTATELGVLILMEI